MSEEPLEMRVEKLENQVYSQQKNNSSDKIGYLKKKIRECGEKIQDLENNIDDHDMRIEAIKEIEEIKEDVESERRDVEDNVEAMEVHVEDGAEIVDNMKYQNSRLDELLERWDEMLDDYHSLVIDQAKYLAEMMLATKRSNSTILRREFMTHFPSEDDLALRVQDMLENSHILTQENFSELESKYNKWVRLTELAEDIDTPTCIRNDPDIFIAYMFRLRKGREVNELLDQGYSQEEAYEEISFNINVERNLEELEKARKELGIDDTELEVDGDFMLFRNPSEEDVKRVLTELYACKRGRDMEGIREEVSEEFDMLEQDKVEAFEYILEVLSMDKEVVRRVDLKEVLEREYGSN